MICMFINEANAGISAVYQGISTHILDTRAPNMAKISVRTDGDDTVDVMVPAAG